MRVSFRIFAAIPLVWTIVSVAACSATSRPFGNSGGGGNGGESSSSTGQGGVGGEQGGGRHTYTPSPGDNPQKMKPETLSHVVPQPSSGGQVLVSRRAQPGSVSAADFECKVVA